MCRRRRPRGTNAYIAAKLPHLWLKGLYKYPPPYLSFPQFPARPRLFISHNTFATRSTSRPNFLLSLSFLGAVRGLSGHLNCDRASIQPPQNSSPIFRFNCC
jgi:hypothetical protein